MPGSLSEAFGTLFRVLPIDIHTVDGPLLAWPTPEELTALLGRMGGAEGDEELEVRGLSGGPEGSFRVGRHSRGPYEATCRPANVETSVLRASTGSHPEITEVLLSWARSDNRWRTALAWEEVDLFGTPELPDEVRAEAEEVARSAMRTGFVGREQAAEAILEVLSEPVEGRGPITPGEAARVSEAVWRQRLSQEADWPEVTDPDRVRWAFTALAAQGITARANFECCSRCAISVIGEEAAEGDRGFVFFHQQDTAHAAEGGALSIRYGQYNGTREQNASVGRAVSEALGEAGVRVEWAGDPGQVISVPLEWRKRVATDG